jgi:hypothetical protein
MADSPATEMKMLNRCNQHRGCRVDFDGECCPVCETVLEMACQHAETRGAKQWCEQEIDRLKKLETENRNLQSRIFELEDQLPEEDLEDDAPSEEPRRPEDMGARHGLDVSAGLGGGGGS